MQSVTSSLEGSQPEPATLAAPPEGSVTPPVQHDKEPVEAHTALHESELASIPPLSLMSTVFSRNTTNSSFYSPTNILIPTTNKIQAETTEALQSQIQAAQAEALQWRDAVGCPLLPLLLLPWPDSVISFDPP